MTSQCETFSNSRGFVLCPKTTVSKLFRSVKLCFCPVLLYVAPGGNGTYELGPTDMCHRPEYTFHPKIPCTMPNSCFLLFSRMGSKFQNFSKSSQAIITFSKHELSENFKISKDV